MKHRLIACWLAVAAMVPILWPELSIASSGGEAREAHIKVLAVETFLADIAQNVAGGRVKVNALLPEGADPHDYDATPSDLLKVAASDVVIVNGAGLEAFLDRLIQNAGGTHRIIDASAGLQYRTNREGEETEPRDDHKHAEEAELRGHHHDVDPHFWLVPLNAVKYVENIRDGLSQADPEGKATYAANADDYIIRLKDLDKWIEDRVKDIPQNRRLLVTNHESFGYFADRYGFRIVGTIVPSVSTEASPSAQQLAHLVDTIKTTGVHAIFLETGTNRQLPQQVARETGVKVEELYDHSLSEHGGPAPDYISMIKYDTMTIVNALK